jgi:Fe-S cluster assembly iron-binding protein IscA
MALDEPKESDEVYEIEGFKYVVDKDFMEKAKPVKIDFTTYGFKLSSNIDFGPVASGCSGCSATGSCD